MKNLKMFAIGLVAFAAMTIGVHAAGSATPGTISYVDKDGVTKSGTFSAVLKDASDHSKDNDNMEVTVTVKDGDITDALTTNLVIEGNIVLDLGGHKVTLTSSANSEFIVEGGTLKITGAEKSAIETAWAKAIIKVLGSNSHLTIDTNVTLEHTNTSTTVPVVSLNKGTDGKTQNSSIVIRGKLINDGSGVALNVNGQIKDKKNVSTITIEDNAELISKKDTAIYQAGNVNTTIGKATIEGSIGIGAKAGTLTLNGTTVTGNGPKDSADDNGNGLNPVGAAIQIETSAISDYLSPVTLTLNGGEYTSENGSVIVINGFENDTLALAENSVIKGGAVLTAADDEPVISLYAKEAESAKSLLASLESFVTNAEYSGDLVGDMTIGDTGSFISADTLKAAILKGASVTTDDEGNTVVGGGSSSSNTPSTPSDENKPNTGDTANTPSDSKNPQTGDSIMTYMGLGIASIAVVGLGAKNLKKQTSR